MSVEGGASEGRHPGRPYQGSIIMRPNYTLDHPATDVNCQPRGGIEGDRQEEWQTAALTNTAYQFY